MKIVRFTVVIVLLTVWLIGCARGAAPVSLPADPVVESREEIQSNREREMVILFQILVQMDKKSSLVINKKQAERLLPLIQRNSNEGELAQSDQKEILAILSGEQKYYVDDLQDRIHSQIEAFKDLKERPGLSHEERESMIREFQLSRKKLELDGDLPSPPPPPPTRYAEEHAAGPGAGSGANVERQLIELLESKLSREVGK